MGSIDLLLFTHSSAEGHLGCFHLLVIVSSAAINSSLQASIHTIF